MFIKRKIFFTLSSFVFLFQFSVVYQCHCCKKKLKRGGNLTKHLMKLHNYHWPSGHTRFRLLFYIFSCIRYMINNLNFRYRKDQDGIYRLQTVRYESLEVTEEMIKSETMQSKKSFSLKYDNESPSSHVLLSIHDDNLDEESYENQQNDVVITINDVDEYGNIVKSQVGIWQVYMSIYFLFAVKGNKILIILLCVSISPMNC